MEEKYLYQREGLKWLYEMELLRSPELINNLKFNILMVSNSIKECELLMNQDLKAILIYLDLTWWGSRFGTNDILRDVEDVVRQLLPSFKIRVVTDRKILELALERVENEIKGGSHEESVNPSSDVGDATDDRGSEGKLSPASDLLPDQEESPFNEFSEGDGIVRSNLQGDEKA